TPSGPVLTPPAAGWASGSRVTNEPLLAVWVVVPMAGVPKPAGVAGTPPRTGWPDRPGAGVPVAPIGGSEPWATVELCTGCSCCGAPIVFRLEVLLVEEQPATTNAIAANPATDIVPRFQTIIG